MSSALEITLNLGRQDLALGVVLAHGVTAAPAPRALLDATQRCIADRQSALDPLLDARRQACRDMLRHGRYKPTGRGKPANEYLLRAAAEGTFPRINGLVDANNLVSLSHMVPISLWDLDLADGDRITFRHGRAGESYVFNSGGQVLDLVDLVCGCVLGDGAPDGEPIVNPIKDCLKTKTTPDTTRVAAAIYCPLEVLDEEGIGVLASELASWLSQCGQHARTACGVVMPNGTTTLCLAPAS